MAHHAALRASDRRAFGVPRQRDDGAAHRPDDAYHLRDPRDRSDPVLLYRDHVFEHRRHSDPYRRSSEHHARQRRRLHLRRLHRLRCTGGAGHHGGPYRVVLRYVRPQDERVRREGTRGHGTRTGVRGRAPDEIVGRHPHARGRRVHGAWPAGHRVVGRGHHGGGADPASIAFRCDQGAAWRRMDHARVLRRPVHHRRRHGGDGHDIRACQRPDRRDGRQCVPDHDRAGLRFGGRLLVPR